MDNKRRKNPEEKLSGYDVYGKKDTYSSNAGRRISRVDPIGSTRRRRPSHYNDYTHSSGYRSVDILSDNNTYVDYKKSNSYGTRRVNTDRMRYGNEAGRTAYGGMPSTRNVTDADRRRRIEAARKKKRQKNIKLRAALILLGCAAFTAVLMLMTPIFDITQIRLEGNNTVSKSVIEEKIGYCIGKNLFTSSTGKIKRQMLEISQISDVQVTKKLFPAELIVSVTESNPAAYLLSGQTIVVINSELKVIDDSNSYDTDSIPSLSGVSVPVYKLNETLETDSEEKNEVLRTLLTTLEASGLISKVTYISLDDLSEIKFNYDNRIEVTCGSYTELERKIRMFTVAVDPAYLSENAIGSMDLSVPGNVLYTPYTGSKEI